MVTIPLATIYIDINIMSFYSIGISDINRMSFCSIGIYFSMKHLQSLTGP